MHLDESHQPESPDIFGIDVKALFQNPHRLQMVFNNDQIPCPVKQSRDVQFG